jgi:hypothetical protein
LEPALLVLRTMARFVLQPCHLREGKLAPLKGTQPLVLDWSGLVEKLAPSREARARMTLKSMQPGAYVGTVQDQNNPKIARNFVFANQDRSAHVDWILKKDPTFETRLLDVYRVDEVRWDAAVTEFDTPGIPPWG